jgi:two-component system, NtrC family, response regulator GlrR
VVTKDASRHPSPFSPLSATQSGLPGLAKKGSCSGTHPKGELGEHQPEESSAAPGARDSKTLTCVDSRAPVPGSFRRFALVVVEGPASGATWHSTRDRCSIGAHRRNDFVVDDPTVSRFHCEIMVDANGVCVRDLKSRNGTMVDGVSVVEAFLRDDSLIRLGETVVRFERKLEMSRLPLSEETRFGSLFGVSVSMRAVFSMLERVAQSDVTVLLEGETGTGKSQAALSIHQKSSRSKGPFMVVDCGAILGNLLESELFGHEKGSFTGATERRVGAFEAASEGTLFLDEIGELPLDLQPKLLRALEMREVRRVGSNAYRPIDTRVIAATNRDLRADVNVGRFRADLYFRLAVVTVNMPPLRQRPEDVPMLVDGIVHSLRVPDEIAESMRAPEFIAQLRRATWPGNARELRNYIERCLVLRTVGPMSGDTEEDVEGLQHQEEGCSVDPTEPYALQRERAIAEFERRYIKALLLLYQGKVARAALSAGIDRAHLYRLLRRHDICVTSELRRTDMGREQRRSLH